jgi:hypothetical protein
LPLCQSPSKKLPIQRNAKILDFERDTYPSPVLAIRRSRGHPKNDGCSKSESVTAVTATEAGSAAGYSGGRYGIMKPSPVAAEAGRSYPLKGPARAI